MSKRPTDLNALAAEIHADNQHWWHDPATGAPIRRNVGEMFMLMVSELSEAMEGERKDLMDDHLPHRKMAEVEMADFVIRVLDFGGGFGFRFDAGVQLPIITETYTNRGSRLFDIVRLIAELGEEDAPGAVGRQLTWLIRYAERYCLDFGYDLWGAVEEKRAYNRVRADHKAEARLAAGGKKW